MKYLLTSESVTAGHPDKICDRISDSILDACLEQDHYSRVACEAMVTTGTAIVSGEITTKANINYTELIRKTIKEIWYDNPESCFDADNIWVHLILNKQSPDIALGVDKWGAWDQWIMFWYATNESEDYLPLTISLAHKLAKQLHKVREEKILPYLLPDGKTQVTIEFENNKPKRIHTIVVSSQHKENISTNQLKEEIKNEVILPIVSNLIDEKTIIYINPTWKFVIWWPKWDCWLTGRKIMVDTYGWIWRHWGGAFSGKDPTKVDRSWAYIARYLAKNIVASWICDKAEIQLSYAIWVKEPISIYIDCFWTEKVDKQKIIKAIKENFDLSPEWIIKKLDLRKPIYKKTSSYGHFGRNDVSWEKLDSIEIFKRLG